MDTVRSYPALLGLEVVNAELFPVISLGDTPTRSAGVAQSGSRGKDGAS
jgi:hypothetical protein